VRRESQFQASWRSECLALPGSWPIQSPGGGMEPPRGSTGTSSGRVPRPGRPCTVGDSRLRCRRLSARSFCRQIENSARFSAGGCGPDLEPPRVYLVPEMEPAAESILELPFICHTCSSFQAWPRLCILGMPDGLTSSRGAKVWAGKNVPSRDPSNPSDSWRKG
jgi:hypothetical protein